MRTLLTGFTVLGCIISVNAFSASTYVCQDVKNGTKYAQAAPCLAGHEQIKMYKGAGSADTTKVVALNQQPSAVAQTSTPRTSTQQVVSK